MCARALKKAYCSLHCNNILLFDGYKLITNIVVVTLVRQLVRTKYYARDRGK